MNAVTAVLIVVVVVVLTLLLLMVALVLCAQELYDLQARLQEQVIRLTKLMTEFANAQRIVNQSLLQRTKQERKDNPADYRQTSEPWN